MNPSNQLGQSNTTSLLEAHGVYPTAQRLAVADAMLCRHQHLTADDVYDRVRRFTHISKATIYNTLALFSRAGLVREIVADPSKVFYDSNTSPHHHFFNVDNGELTDIDHEMLSAPTLTALPEGMVLDSMDVVVRIKKAR